MPPQVQPQLLISASAVAIWAITRKGQLLLGAGQNFVVNRLFNVSHEIVVGSPFIFESVMHGVRVTFQGGQLLLVRTSLSEMGLVPTKDGILGWQPIDLRFVALAGEMSGRTLLFLQSVVLENVTDQVQTQTTLSHSFSGTGRICLEANEIGSGN